MKRLTKFLGHFFWLAALLLSATVIQAQTKPTVVGYWLTYDQESHQPSSVVHITVDSQGHLVGNIVKVLGDADAVCSACSGDLHNKPLAGLPVLWDFSQNTEGWTGGKILAVKKGAVFDNARLTLDDSGNQLTLTVQVFGSARSQTWTRTNKTH